MTDQRSTPFINGRPGRSWFGAFLKRNPKLAERNAESISRGRGALTEGCIRGWFADAHKFFAENNCEYILMNNTRQYNADETGFQLDPKTGRVLAPRGEVIYTESGGQKEQISVLITTRADGKVMTSCIVYPYKRGVPKAIIDNIPSGFCAARSDSGWMTSAVFYEYVANTFIPELAKQRKLEKNLSEDEELVLTDADWVVLWVDGYSSHLTVHTSKVCELNKIILYCFKAHASHVCQPNDVGPFKLLKAKWKSAVAAWRLTHPYEQLTRVSFALLLGKAVENLNPDSIISGYRATGLYPFDPNAIHYERLTSTNSAKFDESAFAPAEATDYKIAVQCIETILGKETVDKYCCAMETSSDEGLPQVSAFDIWKQLKVLTSSVGPVTNGKTAWNLSECCSSSTGVENESVASSHQICASVVMSSCAGVISDKAVSTSIDPCSIQQCGYNAVVDNEIGEARNSRTYQPDNQPLQQATLMMNNAPGPYLSSSMVLNDTDLSASTLLNLDLSMSELSGISQQLVSSPLQQDQSLVTSVISAAVSSCDNNQRPAPFAMATRDHQLVTSLVQSAAKATTLLPVINGPLDTRASPWVESQSVPELTHLQSASMTLNDRDLSASTLLNLDLSMPELSGISQQIVSSPLQQDQSLVTSVISAAVSSCDNNQGPAPFAMETRDHHSISSLVQTAASTATASTLSIINGPLDANISPLVQSQCAPELNHLHSTKNVVLEVSDSPSKAKRGIPVWYEGKVSPAFAQHIFWPSPPKRKAPRVAH